MSAHQVNDNEPRVPDATIAPAAKVTGREAAPQLPARFYTVATVSDCAEGFAIELDGRPLKTPKKLSLIVPSRALAEAVAAEWAAQGARIDPTAMPLTRLANTALDAVTPHLAGVRADIVHFASSDALCYRAAEPARLTQRQAEVWDPVLAWAEQTFNARFTTQTGILHVTQPPATLSAIARAVAPFDAFALTPLHVMTTLMGSSVLALAVAHGALAPDGAWTAAHLDEDWQIATWGRDDEAVARRAWRWREMASAAQFLATLR